MNQLEFLVLLVMGMAVGAIASTSRSNQQLDRAVDCGKYAQDWRISSCASSLRQRNLISKFMYNNYLDQAKATGVPQNTYYSVGLMLGTERRIIGGTINDPIFEKSLSVTVDPSDAYFNKKLIDLGKVFDKPVALFTLGEMKDIPEWDGDFMSSWQRGGNADLSVIYKAKGAGPIDLSTATEKCGEFARWVDTNLSVKKRGVAIHMGPDLWCPVLQNGVMEIVVAKVEKAKVITYNSNREEIYVATSATWGPGRVFGEDNVGLAQVFL